MRADEKQVDMNRTSLTIGHPNATRIDIPTEEVTLWFGVYMSVCVIGDCTNLLLGAAILSDRHLRKGAGILILHSLAVYLLNTALFTPLFGIMFYGTRVWNWPIPGWSCKYWFPGFGAVAYAMNWADFIIGWNRFIAVFAPHSYKGWTTPKAFVSQLVFVWVICIMVGILPAYGVFGTYDLTPVKACAYLASGKGGDIRTAIGIYIPLAVVGFFYLLLALKFFQKKVNTAKNLRPGVVDSALAVPEKTLQGRLDLAWSLLLTFLFQCLTYLPMNIVASFFPKVLASQMVFMWLRTISFAGPAFSPVVLILTNRRYRKACRRLFSKRRFWTSSSVHTVSDMDRQRLQPPSSGMQRMNLFRTYYGTKST